MTYSVQEIKTMQADRQYYLDLGYPFEVAQQYAYDHMMASRKGMVTV